MEVLIFAILIGLGALGFAALRARDVLAEDDGNDTMRGIAASIQEGAATFLKREYTFIGVFVAVVFVVLIIFVDYDVLDKFTRSPDLPETAISYLIGAILSAGAGYAGMTIAVRANVRTAASAQKGLNPALRTAFNSGTVMGMTVVGLGLLGVSVLYIVWESFIPLTGFAFGASSIALFARVGGGIFTKAADVGADLVGKIEAGIPEDDPRNPATIADNVGDNVGDVAGMGADLFESYVGSIVATIALGLLAVGSPAIGGAAVFDPVSVTDFDSDPFILPILVAAIGIISAVLGTFLVRTGEDIDQGGLLWALRAGVFGASALVLLGSGIAIAVMGLDDNLFWAILVGLLAGQIIGTVTEGFTSTEGFNLGPFKYNPTVELSEQAESGAGPVIIGGLSLGMLSTAVPMITIVIAIFLAQEFAGFYGIALAAVGMLAPLGVTLATDAYGPVADNAGGIAEQAGLPPEVRQRTDALDQLGNTTAATGKGFAIGSAMLTSLALLATYATITNVTVFNLLDWEVMVGILLGGLMPFIFSALSMGAVGRAAQAMVEEVRRQFREQPGIMDGTEEPDHARAIAISTDGALREMIVPGLLAVTVPIIVGAVISAEALGGLLIGSIAAGSMMAIMMANAGGAWDNAKKYIEEGHSGGKGSEAHKAAVVGDTVGDPFKGHLRPLAEHPAQADVHRGRRLRSHLPLSAPLRTGPLGPLRPARAPATARPLRVWP